jgi:hypothetical protein
VVTVVINGTPSLLTCTISGDLAVACNDTIHTVTFNDGDLISVLYNETVDPAPAWSRVVFGFRYSAP